MTAERWQSYPYNGSGSRDVSGKNHGITTPKTYTQPKMTAVCDVPPKTSIMSPAPTVNAAATNLGELKTKLHAVARTGEENISPT
jgi:hypothetical protein